MLIADHRVPGVLELVRPELGVIRKLEDHRDPQVEIEGDRAEGLETGIPVLEVETGRDLCGDQDPETRIQDQQVGIGRDRPEDQDLETRIPCFTIKQQIIAKKDLVLGMRRGRPEVILIVTRNGQDRDLEIGFRERMNIPEDPRPPLPKRKCRKLQKCHWKSKFIMNNKTCRLHFASWFITDHTLVTHKFKYSLWRPSGSNNNKRIQGLGLPIQWFINIHFWSSFQSTT